jgi:hypothetical protein
LEIQPRSREGVGQRSEIALTAIERFLYRHKFTVVVACSLMYFVGTLLRARGKPFWFDEIITLLASREPTYSATLRATRELDWSPPFTNLVGHLVNGLAGSGEIAFRIPAMIGFWVFCLCLFGFAIRRVNMYFAITAMLLPFATLADSYSFEARNYGMMLGFCGVALLSWQTAALGTKRAVSILGLVVGIAGALSCHYFAALIYLPLAAAEGLRTIRQRKLDKAIWTAFVLGAIPLIASLAQMIHVTTANHNSFEQASRHDYFTFYDLVYAPSTLLVVPALMLLAAWFVLRSDQEAPAVALKSNVPDYEVVAAAMFLLIPAADITLAIMLPPHVFHFRYALPSIAGFALLPCLLAAQCAGGRLTVALGPALVIPAFLVFAHNMTLGRPLQTPLQQQPLLTEGLKQGPVAVSNLVAYLQLWYYAPENMKSRILYLTDEESSAKYLHHEDRMEVYRRFGVPVVPYKDFVVSGKEFFLYFIPGINWLPEKLLDDGSSLQVIKWDQGNALFLVHVK